MGTLLHSCVRETQMTLERACFVCCYFIIFKCMYKCSFSRLIPVNLTFKQIKTGDASACYSVGELGMVNVLVL